ncbi:MAG: hypothetical protein JW883_16560 [Deltaproteobacteria bacterium]|nr:hypothetical protein [Deltaproteobacteria bacterium]
MPRRAGLDASGSLHHVIFRGIERRKIVDDYRDRRDIVSRQHEQERQAATTKSTLQFFGDY